MPPEGVVVIARDITEGLVYENNGVKVTAIEVDHYPIQPSYGYRIEYAGRSVVYSGDTRFSEHLIECAQGTDVIIHEVVAADSIREHSTKSSENAEQVITHHTTPD